MHPPLATAYVRWAFLRAALARGYWLTAAVYLVVVAELTPAQLVLVGTFQAVTVVIAEIPAGVLADSVSRRLSLVIGHVVMGAGMAMVGAVTAFPLLVVSQCLWGLGWAFSSGADVAWITDELDRPDEIDRVLVGQARWDLVGTPIGLLGFGALAWASTLATAVVVAGTSMVLLGLVVVARWPETRRARVDAGARWRQSWSVLRSGVSLARADRVVLVLLVANVFVNGSEVAPGRLRELRLVGLGMPSTPDPIVWFAAISIVGAVLGAVVLRFVEARIAGSGVARRTYLRSCAVGVLGVLIFAHAPDTATAVAGAFLVFGVAHPALRAVGVIWVNRRVSSAVRATVHSMLSFAEHLGEIVCGVALALVARFASTSTTLTASAVVLAIAGLLVVRLRDASDGG